MLITPEQRAKLKSPLGKLCTNFDEVKKLVAGKRIISVGDVCTLGFIANGMRVHLAVFDHVFMRQKLEDERVAVLSAAFKNPRKYANPAGTLSEEIVRDAPKLLKEGGAILVDGEEDLTALAFVLHGKENDVVVYGQPKKGIVVVEPMKAKKKVEKILSGE